MKIFRIRISLVRVVTCLSCIFFANGPILAEPDSYQLIVSDVLAKPGSQVQLQARLVRVSLLQNIGVGGESVTFKVGEVSVGTAMTGGDGRAFLTFSTAMRGNQVVRAVIESSPRVPSVKGMGILASWERRRPILLIDVKTLMEKQSSLINIFPSAPLVLGQSELPPPAKDAVSQLAKLGEFYYNMVYLVEKDEIELESLREWLRQHDFPPGITRPIKAGAAGLEDLIKHFKEGGWDHLEGGIGLTKVFAEVLIKNRIRAIVFEKSNEESFPRRTIVVKNWKDVRKHL